MLFNPKRLSTGLLIGTLAALVGGFVLLGTTFLSAEESSVSGQPPRPTLAPPEDEDAVSIDEARELLRAIPELNAVLLAAESGVVAALLEMSSSRQHGLWSGRAAATPSTRSL